MKAFKDRFKQHPLQASLEAMWTTLRGIKIPKFSEGDESTVQDNNLKRAAFARIIRVASFISSSIKQSDPTIWTTAALDAARASVDTITRGVEEFQSAGSIAGFEVAGDTALDQFRKAFLSRVSTKSIFALESLTLFSELAETSIRSSEEIDRSIKTKEKEIVDVQEGFAKQIAELSSQIEGFKTQFEAQKTRVDDLVTTQQQSFQTGQSERVTAFNQEVESRKSTHDQLAADRAASYDVWSKSADEKLGALLKSTLDTADANLKEMDRHQARAKEILGIVAASGVSGHYKNTAKREWISAEVLRLLALGCFLAMGILIYHVVDSLKGPDFRWEMGLFRVGVGLALSIPAFYCAKESAKHREAEKRNRRLQIELATIEPYLEKLHSPTEMQKILTEKANSYFMGQLQNEPNDDKEGVLAAKELRRREDQVVDILKALASSIKK